MLVGRSFEHGADEAGLEVCEESHGLDGAFAQPLQDARLIVGAKQSLVFAQRVLDLGVPRQARIVGDAEALSGLELRLPVVAKTAFGDQARRFDRDAAALLLRAVEGVACVVVAIGHEKVRGRLVGVRSSEQVGLLKSAL